VKKTIKTAFSGRELRKNGVFGLIMAAVFIFALTFAGCSNPASSGKDAFTIAVTGVTLDKTSLSVAKDMKIKLTAAVSPANATNTAVRWSSSDTRKATVDSTGRVTGQEPGTATITATTADGSKRADCIVTVTPPVTKITVTKLPAKTDYYIGDEINEAGLVVTATFSDNTTGPITITKEMLSQTSPFHENDAKLGTVSVTIGYGKEIHTSFDVKVRYKITRITVKAPPDVTTGTDTPAFTVDVHAETTGTPPDPVKAVEWSIIEETRAEGTDINAATGVLTVAADETLNALTIKAVSAYDTKAAENGTATVNVIISVTDTNWADTLAAISNAEGGTAGNPKVWTLAAQSDFAIEGATAPNITGNNKTVRLTGTKTISLSGQGSIIWTGTGTNQRVIIDGPTLKGYAPDTGPYNNAPVVHVGGGSVELKSGKISGNNNRPGNPDTSPAVGGVYVATNAVFTMTGGTISGNTNNNDNHSGGGVYVDGTFTMSGGTINNNTGTKAGGVWVNGIFTMSGEAAVTENTGSGVLANTGGTFTMDGGTISGNSTSNTEGGGVYAAGTFTMNNGTIKGNRGSLGGGVFVTSAGSPQAKFTMTGGTITGGTGDAPNTATGNMYGSADKAGNAVCYLFSESIPSESQTTNTYFYRNDLLNGAVQMPANPTDLAPSGWERKVATTTISN
jgi:hypothetical protein